jgi:hypothetical protein
LQGTYQSSILNACFAKLNYQPGKHTHMSLSDVPYDVVMEIVGAIENDGTYESPQLSDVWTLSLTSKSIRQAVLPHLFRSIDLKFPRRSSLRSLPNITLAPLIKELLLHSTDLGYPLDTEWIPVILTFRNLTRLTLRYLSLPSSMFSILPSFRKLDSLMWDYCEEDPEVQITGFASSPLKISELSMAIFHSSILPSLNSIPWETLSSLTITRPHADLSQCKALKTLELEFVPDWGAFLNVIVELSELNTLHVNDGDSRYTLPLAIPFLPKLTSLRCPIALLAHFKFQGSPLLVFDIICDDNDFDFDTIVSLPPFDTLLHLVIPLVVFRHLGDTSLKSLYPNLQSLAVDQPETPLGTDFQCGAPLLEEDVVSLVSYAHVLPPIHSLVFSDTIGRRSLFNLVHQHRLISEQLSPAIPSLRTFQLDKFTKCTWTKGTVPAEGEEESDERKARVAWRPCIPRTRFHSIQGFWKSRWDFHDYDNCFTQLLGLDTLLPSESSPDGHDRR